MVMSCCPAAPAFSFHVAVLGAALHVHELLSSFCELLSSSFASCRPTFASFERGDTQGETRGRGAAHQLCKLLFSSFGATVQQLLLQVWCLTCLAFNSTTSCFQNPAPPHAEFPQNPAIMTSISNVQHII
jgi:hypothetical protein